MRRTLVIIALALATLLALTLRPYGMNITALFHFDSTMHAEHPAPKGFVVLDAPGYDGMLYYEIARRVPDLFTAKGRAKLGTMPLRSYAYQRILLPAATFLLSAGRVTLLPYAFLLINVASLLGVAWLVLRWKPGTHLYALALALCPAALTALHFNLAEPLTLLLLTWFLTRYPRHPERSRGVDTLDLLLLSLLTLSREVNILFVGLLLLWFGVHRQWKAAVLLLIPLGVFLAWHGVLWHLFGTIPFLTSAAKRTLPFAAIFDVLRGVQGTNRLTLSAMAFFLGFMLPAIVWIPMRSLRTRHLNFLAFGGLAFLLLMTTMAWDIWGSITSIGRVITPVYPLTILYAAKEKTLPARAIAVAILALGLATGLSLAMTPHPFHLA